MGSFFMLKIIFVIIGALIGAGFASGQEIYLFFFSYGIKGIVGIIISSILFSLVIYKVFNIVDKNKIQSYKQFLEVIIGTDTKLKRYCISILNIFINLFILITFFIMIAGFGTYLSENLSISQILGSSILAILCIIILSKETKGLVNVSQAIVPVLIVFILIIGIISSKQINFSYIIAKDTNWFISSILYTSYNMILLIPVLISLNNEISDIKTYKVAISVGIIISILAFCVYIAMTQIMVNIEHLEMPISYVVATKFPYLKFIYGIIILSSILTTAIALGIGFLQNIHKNKDTKVTIMIAICIASIPISTIGFSNLIRFLYPIFGYLGLVQILKIITMKTVEKT